MRVFLKMLNSHSHEAEFGQMDRIWHASLKRGGDGGVLGLGGHKPL